MMIIAVGASVVWPLGARADFHAPAQSAAKSRVALIAWLVSGAMLFSRSRRRRVA